MQIMAYLKENQGMFYAGFMLNNLPYLQWMQDEAPQCKTKLKQNETEIAIITCQST